MKYYRRRRRRTISRQAKEIFFKILFVLAAAVLITGLAILTGNLLLEKVNRTREHLETSVPPSGNAAGRVEQSDLSGIEGVYSSLQVCAAGLDLSLHDTEDSLVARVHAISASYDTVSVEITGETGLLYTSPALSSLMRLPVPGEEDPLFARLSALCTAAKAQELRLSAVVRSSLPLLPDADTAALVDSTIAAELYDLGFNEVLFTDAVHAAVDTDGINIARRYLQTVKENLSYAPGFAVGICLPVSIYLDSASAKQLQMVASAVDFLALDCAELPVTSEEVLTLGEICQSLAGSFQAYNPRMVLRSADPALLAAQYDQLNRMEITNIYFLAEVTPESLAQSLISDIPETLPAETEAPEETTPTTNPYATTTTPDGSPSSPTEEETYYRSEDGSWF